MAEQPSYFEELLRRVRAGSESAARELFDTYGEHILRVIRRRLSRRMRSIYDSVDFQQAVWASFFAMPPERVEFRTPEELANYLTAMADHKVVDEYKHVLAQKRDLTREVHVAELGEVKPEVEQTTPSQYAVADEYWERLMAGRPPAVRQMIEMLRDGHSYGEIAARTGLHEKAIQRYVQRLRKGVTP